MSDKPLVSIITPTCNRDLRIVQRCIQCVRSQTYEHWEHIVCSDGVLEPHIKTLVESDRDARMKYMVTAKKHGGYGGAVREEIINKIPLGKLLVFYDDDNVIFPTYLEKMVKALVEAKNDEKFAICQIFHFGPLQPFFGPPPILLEGEPKLYYIDTLQVMVEAEAMKKVGWVNPLHYCSDGMTYEALGKAYKWVKVPECLGVHL